MGTLLLQNPETGDEVEVEYTISGRYYRGSYYDPPESPDVEFEDLPTWANEDHCIELALEQEAAYAEDDRAEAAMDAYEARMYDDHYDY